jgi:exopolyphosphatase / guanosine-5'-triphosphate,3'-diphosphate pyrophosphatase
VERFAAIDIGTNSVRLLIRDRAGAQRVRDIEMTRLGEGVDASGVLQPLAQQRTLEALGRFATRCREESVQALRMTATSAARDAKNCAEFFARVKGIVGQEPELLLGEQEAAMSFAGATAEFTTGAGPFLVFDIGGGSTEFSRGSVSAGVASGDAAGSNIAGSDVAAGAGKPELLSISLDIGAVRLTERCLHSDPPTSQECAQARDLVARQFERVEGSLDVRSKALWIGLAGTVTTFAALALGLKEYARHAVHGYRLQRATVVEILERLLHADLKERRALLLQPQRAEIIVAGGLILEGIFNAFEPAEVLVSESDILDGLAASLISG